MATKVQFTVGKLDAGMAILLTRDPKESMHLVEFPSVLLPSGVKSGSIIDISVAQNPTEEDAENEAFSNLQEDILAQFGTAEPKTPELRLRNATQTSVVLEWDPVEIATAELRSLALYKNNARLGNIPDPLHNTSTKLSGLAIDTAYSFHLVLKTSAGTYTSPKLNVKTHKMTDLTGLQICVSDTPPLTAEEQTALMASLQAIGAREPQTNVKIDTTHFICKEPRGPEWEKANEMNIPIVVPEWVTACEREGRLVGVKAYYLGADPALRVVRGPAGPPPGYPESRRGSMLDVPTRSSLAAGAAAEGAAATDSTPVTTEPPIDEGPEPLSLPTSPPPEPVNLNELNLAEARVLPQDVGALDEGFDFAPTQAVAITPTETPAQDSGVPQEPEQTEQAGKEEEQAPVQPHTIVDNTDGPVPEAVAPPTTEGDRRLTPEPSPVVTPTLGEGEPGPEGHITATATDAEEAAPEATEEAGVAAKEEEEIVEAAEVAEGKDEQANEEGFEEVAI